MGEQCFFDSSTTIWNASESEEKRELFFNVCLVWLLFGMKGRQNNNDLSASAAPLKLTLSGSAYSSVTNWHGRADMAALRELMALYVNEHQVMYNLPKPPFSVTRACRCITAPSNQPAQICRLRAACKQPPSTYERLFCVCLPVLSINLFSHVLQAACV